jgi:hypothetical protein
LKTTRRSHPVISAIVVAMFVAVPMLVSACGDAEPIPTPTTAAISASASAAADSAAVQQYRDDLQSWVDTYWNEEDIGIFDFADPFVPTAAELQRVHEFADFMHESVAALKKIGAPASLAEAHAQFCTSIAREVIAMDRLILAIENNNPRDAELAFRKMFEARSLEEQALMTLGPYLEQAPVIQN